ncbi:MAG: hypothetical protein NUV76_09580 [Candidatus Kuenenia sp.]|nr:hypothetical protein [Candidatus Kuenenia sp.]
MSTCFYERKHGRKTEKHTVIGGESKLLTIMLNRDGLKKFILRCNFKSAGWFEFHVQTKDLFAF